ncbi:MAG: S-layer homology domain-containing protein, partial [Defluviitaleaceae bacterium]|nr:S-layer homology domain-containing protein [Defluviitaleaceae bacterium]
WQPRPPAGRGPGGNDGFTGDGGGPGATGAGDTDTGATGETGAGATDGLDIILIIPVAPMPTAQAHYAYMIGYAEDGTIRPHANITRAEVTTIFFRLITDGHRADIWSQANSFNDVSLQQWFNNPISTMERGGLFTGIPLGQSFYPNQPATRAEFAAMVVNYLGFGHLTGVAADSFTDIEGHWASDAINVAFLQGWVQGYGDGTFRPDQPITRAETAALVNRALGRLPQTVDDLLPGMVTWPDNMDPNRWYYLYIQEATNTHYHVYKADGIHETWTSLLPPRDWRLLERPYSVPGDILR